MSKLTEIKEALSRITEGLWELKGEAVYCDTPTEYEPICQLYANSERDFVNCENNGVLIANAPEYITYLLSLLEEKDKAFERIIEHYNSDGTDTLIAIKMLGEAQNALLTSSNNEGEI